MDQLKIFYYQCGKNYVIMNSPSDSINNNNDDCHLLAVCYVPCTMIRPSLP